MNNVFQVKIHLCHDFSNFKIEIPQNGSRAKKHNNLPPKTPNLELARIFSQKRNLEKKF